MESNMEIVPNNSFRSWQQFWLFAPYAMYFIIIASLGMGRDGGGVLFVGYLIYSVFIWLFLRYNRHKDSYVLHKESFKMPMYLYFVMMITWLLFSAFATFYEEQSADVLEYLFNWLKLYMAPYAFLGTTFLLFIFLVYVAIYRIVTFLFRKTGVLKF
jgi:hypothetical protein